MKTAIERLMDKVRQLGDGCWQWTGSLNRLGYGRFCYQGRNQYAHRAAYEILVGPIGLGLQVDHLCRNPGCVNPDHLEVVTPKENVGRGLLVALKTHCENGHEYTSENTWRTKHGYRRCRTCTRIREAARYSRSCQGEGTWRGN